MNLVWKPLGCAVLALSMFGVQSISAAEKDKYPTDAGRLTGPCGQAAATAVIGRLCAQRFREVWGPAVVVDSRPGAAGIMGTEMAARAPAGGHSFFPCGINRASTAGLDAKL